MDADEEGEFISKCLRGNTLWTLWKGTDYFIVCYNLVRDSNGWTYERQTERTPPSGLTCPKNYLTKAAILCEDWRRRSDQYERRKSLIKSTIRALYKSKERDQILQVKLKAKKGYVIRLHDFALTDAILNVVSVCPSIEGRFQPNGLRYQIPLRLVSDVSFLATGNQSCQNHKEIPSS